MFFFIMSDVALMVALYKADYCGIYIVYVFPVIDLREHISNNFSLHKDKHIAGKARKGQRVLGKPNKSHQKEKQMRLE